MLAYWMSNVVHIAFWLISGCAELATTPFWDRLFFFNWAQKWKEALGKTKSIISTIKYKSKGANRLTTLCTSDASSYSTPSANIWSCKPRCKWCKYPSIWLLPPTNQSKGARPTTIRSLRDKCLELLYQLLLPRWHPLHHCSSSWPPSTWTSLSSLWCNSSS